jgi:hypothetical protein
MPMQLVEFRVGGARGISRPRSGSGSGFREVPGARHRELNT